MQEPSVFTATTRQSSSSTQKAVLVKSWKAQKLVLGAGEGENLARLLDGSPMETGPLQAWASKTVPVSKDVRAGQLVEAVTVLAHIAGEKHLG
jgi:hypothetical protein